MMVACGIAELLRQHDSDLAKTLVVGLQAGQDQIEFLVADGVGKGGRNGEGIGGGEGVGLDVDGTIGAARQRFANHLRRTRGSR